MFDPDKVTKLVLDGAISFKEAEFIFKHYLILEALNHFEWSQTKTADFLGIHRNTIRNVLKQGRTKNCAIFWDEEKQ